MRHLPRSAPSSGPKPFAAAVDPHGGLLPLAEPGEECRSPSSPLATAVRSPRAAAGGTTLELIAALTAAVGGPGSGGRRAAGSVAGGEPGAEARARGSDGSTPSFDSGPGAWRPGGRGREGLPGGGGGGLEAGLDEAGGPSGVQRTASLLTALSRLLIEQASGGRG